MRRSQLGNAGSAIMAPGQGAGGKGSMVALKSESPYSTKNAQAKIERQEDPYANRNDAEDWFESRERTGSQGSIGSAGRNSGNQSKPITWQPQQLGQTPKRVVRKSKYAGSSKGVGQRSLPAESSSLTSQSSPYIARRKYGNQTNDQNYTP